jgi:hypothetical protein
MKKLIIIAAVILLGLVSTLSMKAKRIDNPLPANITADKVLIETRPRLSRAADLRGDAS